jgi:hypothetical protein
VEKGYVSCNYGGDGGLGGGANNIKGRLDDWYRVARDILDGG